MIEPWGYYAKWCKWVIEDQIVLRYDSTYIILSKVVKFREVKSRISGVRGTGKLGVIFQWI